MRTMFLSQESEQSRSANIPKLNSFVNIENLNKKQIDSNDVKLMEYLPSQRL